MQKSVENIWSEAGVRKQTKLNVRDKYRSLVGIMMNLMAKDDEYAQVQYKQGIKRHGNKTVEAMFKECCQLGENDKEAFIPMNVVNFPGLLYCSALAIVVSHTDCLKVGSLATLFFSKYR